MGGEASEQAISGRPCGEVEFLILGPLVAVGPTGAVLSLGPPRQRTVLAALLVNRGVALSVDRLT